jgi:hypothetical protein
MYFSIFFTILLLGLLIYLPYHKIAATLKFLCVVLLVYLIVPFLYKQDWMDIAKNTFIPNIQFNKEFGDEPDKAYPQKAIFNLIPGLSQFQTEILPFIEPELAKEWGIRVSAESRRQ